VDNGKKLAHLGGDHDTKTVILNGAHSYISLSSEWLNADVLAHEMNPCGDACPHIQGKTVFSSSIRSGSMKA
jgi:hypothetical protein